MKISKLMAVIGGVVTMMGMTFTPTTSLAAPVLETTVTPKPTKPTSKQDSMADFEVVAGTLSLKQVPTLKFGGTSVSDVIRGTTLKNPAVSNSLQVTDYQGTNEGWQLMVGLTHFQNSSQQQRANLELGLEKKQTDNTQTTAPMSSVALTSEEAKNGAVTNYQPVWGAKRQTGQGMNHADVVPAETSLS